MCGAVTLSSCIGSFRLSNQLLSWNKSIGGKFVNELVFFVFWIIPVYEITMLADLLVLNSIEFWSGSNPVSGIGVEQRVKGENGEYVIKRNKDGYNVKNIEKDVTVDLRFDEETQTWSIDADGKSTKFMTFIDENRVLMYMPNGETKEVELSDAGVADFKNVVINNQALFAAN